MRTQDNLNQIVYNTISIALFSAGGHTCKRGYNEKHCIHYSDCIGNLKGRSEFCKFVDGSPVLCCVWNDKHEKGNGEYYNVEVDKGHTKFSPLNHNPPSKYHESNEYTSYKPPREGYDDYGPVWDIIPIHDHKKPEQSNYHHRPNHYDQHGDNQDYHHNHHNYPHYQPNYKPTASWSTEVKVTIYDDIETKKKPFETVYPPIAYNHNNFFHHQETSRSTIG